MRAFRIFAMMIATAALGLMISHDAAAAKARKHVHSRRNLQPRCVPGFCPPKRPEPDLYWVDAQWNNNAGAYLLPANQACQVSWTNRFLQIGVDPRNNVGAIVKNAGQLRSGAYKVTADIWLWDSSHPGDLRHAQHFADTHRFSPLDGNNRQGQAMNFYFNGLNGSPAIRVWSTDETIGQQGSQLTVRLTIFEQVIIDSRRQIRLDKNNTAFGFCGF